MSDLRAAEGWSSSAAYNGPFECKIWHELQDNDKDKHIFAHIINYIKEKSKHINITDPRSKHAKHNTKHAKHNTNNSKNNHPKNNHPNNSDDKQTINNILQISDMISKDTYDLIILRYKIILSSLIEYNPCELEGTFQDGESISDKYSITLYTMQPYLYNITILINNYKNDILTFINDADSNNIKDINYVKAAREYVLLLHKKITELCNTNGDICQPILFPDNETKIESEYEYITAKQRELVQEIKLDPQSNNVQRLIAFQNLKIAGLLNNIRIYLANFKKINSSIKQVTHQLSPAQKIEPIDKKKLQPYQKLIEELAKHTKIITRYKDMRHIITTMQTYNLSNAFIRKSLYK